LQGPFEEEEEGIGIASDVDKVEDEDPATPGSLRVDRATRYVSCGCEEVFQSWVRVPWLAREELPGP